MAQLFLDILGRLFLSDQQCGTGMPKIVKTERPKPCLFQCRLENPIYHIIVIKRPPIGLSKNQILALILLPTLQFLLSLAPLVRFEGIQAHRCQVHLLDRF